MKSRYENLRGWLRDACEVYFSAITSDSNPQYLTDKRREIAKYALELHIMERGMRYAARLRKKRKAKGS